MTMKDDNFLSKAISKNISRRSFVKWTAAVGATASMSGLVVQSAAKMAGASSSITNNSVTSDDLSPSKVTTWVPTHCLTCHGWCDLAVGLDQYDVIRKVEGLGGQPKPLGNKHTGRAGSDDANWNNSNPHDDTYETYCKAASGYLPYSIHNRGRICAKGNDCMEHVYDPDRVKYCLERVGARGSGRWKKISWQEAYTKVSAVMRDLGAAAPASGTASDTRHRLVFWVGRNEDHGGTDRFDKCYGMTNHIEHTAICESSRHTAQNTMMKDKFPLPWVHTSGTGLLTDVASGNRAGGDWNMSWKDDCDLFVSCGGNVLESSIPHAAYSQRVADIRRHGGRVIGIDIRQSNTLAWADEMMYVEPGTDAAMVAGVIYEIMSNYNGGVAAMKTRLDSRNNNNYTGLFAAEAGSGGMNQSLETYLYNGTGGREAYYTNIPDARGAAAFTAAIAASYAGGSDANAVTAGDISYLAWAFSDNFGYGTGTSGQEGAAGVTAGTQPPRNPVIDGYRGICKHANGAYTTKMVRALQYLAMGHNDGGGVVFPDTLSEYQKRAGGVNRPGGLNHQVWDPAPGTGGALWPTFHNADVGPNPGNFGIGGNGRGPSVGNGSDGAATPGTADGEMISLWDYNGNGGTKFKLATHNCDQMTIPGIRASIGLDPFLEGQLLNTPHTNPYGDDYLGNTNVKSNASDHDFKVECLLSHKNNPGYSRPNIALDRDTFTSIDPSTGNYRLANYFTIDMQMGDGSIYADIILAECNFLERIANKHWENHTHKAHPQLRQPIRQVWGAMLTGDVVVDANGYGGDTLTAPSTDVGVGMPLYDSKSIWRIFYELARAIESDPANITDNGTSEGAASTAPWNGNLFEGHNWSGANTWQAERDWSLTLCGGGGATIPGATRADKYNYMRTNGIQDGLINEPNFFYDAEVAAFDTTYVDAANQDPNASEVGLDASGTFYGGPVYVPIPQQSDARQYQLTTYRINVHTHARTASCPRLQEILGSAWAVISPNTATAEGLISGDTVELTTTHWDVTQNSLVSRSMEIEVKVTDRAKDGWVGVSHSQGHAIQSFGGDADGDGNDGYKVDNGTSVKSNRFHDRNGTGQNDYSGQPSESQVLSPSWGAAMDNYRWTLKPSAPSTDGNKLSTTGHGSHPNWIINRSSDPIGASAGFFDSKCDIRKI